MTKLTWFPQEIPASLAAALRTLSEEYPLSEKSGGIPLHFQKGSDLNVEITPEGSTVSWNTQAAALRGVGLALAGVPVKGERSCFDLFGIMIDCSRNAVMTVAGAKKMLRCLALSGYNTAMLYTEDTYLLPDEPHFGFLRGAYSLEEIRELDDYAVSLGIELIGCIQTLGHLGTFLRTAGAAPVKDTANVLLADEPETYDLIRKMLCFWSKACRSRRIHIGMDETHDLGRGNYMDRRGFVKNSEIFLRHLQLVSALCEEHGLKPMIWSDMFFSMGSKTGDYYDLKAEISGEVRKGVPSAVDLVYWDYYHKEENFYDEMIRLHRLFDREPVMASGLWTWYRLMYDHKQTVDRAAPCLDSCRKNRLREFFFTMWGDDGAYCGYETAFAGILWGADRAYGSSGDDAERLEKVSRALHCGSFLQALKASQMNWQAPHRDNGAGTLSMLLWDDPLLGYAWRVLKLHDPAMRSELLACLERGLDHLDEYPYAAAAGKLLRKKVELQAELYQAFRQKDMEKISAIQKSGIPAVIDLYDRFAEEFRKQWIARCKYCGMETVQIRLAGVQARYRELARRLGEWQAGRLSAIPELEVPEDERCNPCAMRYQNLAASGVF